MKQFIPEYEVCPHCGYIISSQPQEPYHLTPGIVLQGRYIIGCVIDYGGFGTVYKAWDSTLEIEVAIKEYYPAGVVQRVPGKSNVIVLEGHEKEYKKGIERFLAEAKNTSKFAKNENIVNIQTFFELNNTAYIIMEYLEGCSLSKYLEDNDNKMDSEIAVNVLLSVISALKEVHKSKILHRDISPSNIFLCKNGTVKLIDFGAAKFDEKDDDLAFDIELKPGYAPPEQYQSDSSVQGVWTDIYALGATLYKAVTGVIPDESVNRIIEDNLKKPKEIEPSVPNYLDKTLMKAMALSPELRFKNVEQFEKAIQNKRHVRTVEKELKKRKRRRRVGILVLVILVLSVGGYSLYRFQMERMKEVLPKTTLDIWMIADNTEEQEAKRELFENMSEEFRNEYPQVTFEFSFFNENEYNQIMEEVAFTGESPDLFEAGNLSDYCIRWAASSPKELYELINATDYFYYDTNKDEIIDKRKIPLGYNTQIQLVNKELMGKYRNSISNEKELFLEGYYPTASLSIIDYASARQQLAGVYKVIPNAHIEYANVWCIGTGCNVAEKTCAVRLMYYLLGDSAQEVMCVDNQKYLSINKKILAEYTSTNQELNYLYESLEKNYNVEKKCNFEKYYTDDIVKKYDRLME